MSPAPKLLYDLSFDEIAETCGPDAALQTFGALYRRPGKSRYDIEATASRLNVETTALHVVETSTGSMTKKFVFGLEDGYAVEAVLIKRRDGYSACVSSQVGCAFGCKFCASGQAGLMRNLSPGEIIQQVLHLDKKVSRIVFMGIGEPLNNYKNVLAAIRLMRDRRGMNFSTGGITISTIGIPKALTALREEHLKVNLTISLHATDQQTRSELIPGSRSHDIHEVIERSQSWAARHNRTVTYVYLLMQGINTAASDMGRLIDWFGHNPLSRVNLMRWNPVAGVSLPRTPDKTLSGFRRGLDDAGVNVVVRDTQGNDISAACGQLWLRDARTRAAIVKRGSRRQAD
jgi:23S rRNA (adenine2503-C2)-methyltransferase